jgi:hypothetical protein
LTSLFVSLRCCRSLLFDAVVSIWSAVQQQLQPRVRERKNARNRKAWMDR